MKLSETKTLDIKVDQDGSVKLLGVEERNGKKWTNVFTLPDKKVAMQFARELIKVIDSIPPDFEVVVASKVGLGDLIRLDSTNYTVEARFPLIGQVMFALTHPTKESIEKTFHENEPIIKVV